LAVILTPETSTLKKLIFIIGLFLLPCLSFSQSKLMVLGKCPDCYVQYKAKAGETIEQIASLASLSKEKLFAFNGVKTSDYNRLPTFWRIPVTADNLQKTSTGQPVYHVVEKGDNLYRINLLYFQPGIAQLQEWNGLRNNALKDGELLLVGYLGVNQQEAVTSGTDVLSAAVPSAQASPVMGDAKSTSPQTALQASLEEGFFAAAFNSTGGDKLLQEKTGLCAVFKSITGWSDKRYYVLMNDIAPGTVVRISAGADKFVCAIVLGPLLDIKPNKGLLIRLSNAAAQQLGVAEQLFSVSVNFFQ
jgi:LysM repeat protein